MTCGIEKHVSRDMETTILFGRSRSQTFLKCQKILGLSTHTHTNLCTALCITLCELFMFIISEVISRNVQGLWPLGGYGVSY